MVKNGFTLAEVLITLGIIGVVAAMTMPTLITNVQNKIFYTRFMKARNMIENALQIFESDNDKTIEAGASNSSYREDAENFASYFKGAKFINESNWQKECAGYNKKNVAYNYDSTNRDSNASDICSNTPPTYGLKTMDGMLIILNQDLGMGNGGFVDTDGSNNGPNTVGRDIFFLYLNKVEREGFCNSIWGLSKPCAESKGQTLDCTDNNKSGSDCAQRLIEEGKMAY